MSAATLTQKATAAQACLADLEQRGDGHLVDSAFITGPLRYPVIRLHRKPQFVTGGSIVRRGKDRRLMGANHLGCQLRWEAPVL